MLLFRPHNGCSIFIEKKLLFRHNIGNEWKTLFYTLLPLISILSIWNYFHAFFSMSLINVQFVAFRSITVLHIFYDHEHQSEPRFVSLLMSFSSLFTSLWKSWRSSLLIWSILLSFLSHLMKDLKYLLGICWIIEL